MLLTGVHIECIVTIMKLKEYRKLTGMLLKDVANKIGVYPSHVSMIEHGHRRPSPKLAKKISKMTKGAVTIEELLF